MRRTYHGEDLLEPRASKVGEVGAEMVPVPAPHHEQAVIEQPCEAALDAVAPQRATVFARRARAVAATRPTEFNAERMEPLARRIAVGHPVVAQPVGKLFADAVVEQALDQVAFGLGDAGSGGHERVPSPSMSTMILLVLPFLVLRTSGATFLPGQTSRIPTASLQLMPRNYSSRPRRRTRASWNTAEAVHSSIRDQQVAGEGYRSGNRSTRRRHVAPRELPFQAGPRNDGVSQCRPSEAAAFMMSLSTKRQRQLPGCSAHC